MAFSTTLTLTINAIAKVLNRVRDDGYSSEFLLRTSTEEYRVNIRHSHYDPKTVNPLLRGMDRHNLEVVHTIFATTTTPQITRKAYTVFEFSPGDDLTAAGQFVSGALTYAIGGTRIDDQIAWLT